MDVTASQIGWTFVGAVAAATAVHGVAHVVRDRLHPETEATETQKKSAFTEEK